MIRYFTVMLLAACAWGQTWQKQGIAIVGPASGSHSYNIIAPPNPPKPGDCLKVEATGAGGNLYELVPIDCPEPLDVPAIQKQVISGYGNCKAVSGSLRVECKKLTIGNYILNSRKKAKRD